MLRNYSVLQFKDGVDELVKKTDVAAATRDNGVDLSLVPRFVAYEDIFDAIRKVHVNAEGHSGFRKTHIQCSHFYSNISREICKYYTDACHCTLDRKHHSKPESIKPILSTSFNSRGQVDLVDMSAYKDPIMPEGKYIMHYQDHHDKMSYVRVLTEKTPKAVAKELFLLFMYQVSSKN